MVHRRQRQSEIWSMVSSQICYNLSLGKYNDILLADHQLLYCPTSNGFVFECAFAAILSDRSFFSDKKAIDADSQFCKVNKLKLLLDNQGLKIKSKLIDASFVVKDKQTATLCLQICDI